MNNLTITRNMPPWYTQFHPHMRNTIPNQRPLHTGQIIIQMWKDWSRTVCAPEHTGLISTSTTAFRKVSSNCQWCAPLRRGVRRCWASEKRAILRPITTLCNLQMLYHFIYLFTSWLHWVHCCLRAFSNCGEQGLLSYWAAQVLGCAGPSTAGTQAQQLQIVGSRARPQ